MKRSVDLTLNGYLLLNYNDSPSLTLYIEYEGDKWLYFCYKDGVLTSVSTDNDYIYHLIGIKEKQRHFMNKNTGEEYEYVIGDFEEVNNFRQIVSYLKGKY